MESNEEYLNADSILVALDLQLNYVEYLHQQQDFDVKRREIEEHFERCAHALEARKLELLDQLEALSQQRADTFEKLRVTIQEVTQDCKDIINAGSLLYKKNKAGAEQIWQGTRAISLPDVDEGDFGSAFLDLPELLLASISTHGEVVSSLSKVAKLTESTEVLPHAPTPTPIPTPILVVPSPEPSQYPLSTKIPVPENPIDVPTPFASTSTLIGPKFTQVNAVTTVAGIANGSGSGKKAEVLLRHPLGICFNSKDNCFYFCDSLDIKKLTLQGQVSTFSFRPSFSPHDLRNIAFYEKEEIFYATSGDTIFQISKNGELREFKKFNYASLPNIRVNYFGNLHGITIDQRSGTVFVSNSDCGIIFTVSQQGVIAALSVQVREPKGIAFDVVDESLLVCELGCITRVSMPGSSKSHICTVKSPGNIAIISNENFLVTCAQKILMVSRKNNGSHLVSEIAGSGEAKSVDGNAKECSFQWPYDIAIHEESNSCFVRLEG